MPHVAAWAMGGVSANSALTVVHRISACENMPSGSLPSGSTNNDNLPSGSASANDDNLPAGSAKTLPSGSEAYDAACSYRRPPRASCTVAPTEGEPHDAACSYRRPPRARC